MHLLLGRTGSWHWHNRSFHEVDTSNNMLIVCYMKHHSRVYINRRAGQHTRDVVYDLIRCWFPTGSTCVYMRLTSVDTAGQLCWPRISVYGGIVDWIRWCQMINCHNSITTFTAHRRSSIINLAPCHPSFASSLTTLRVHCEFVSGSAAMFVMNSPSSLAAAQYKPDASKRHGLALDYHGTIWLFCNSGEARLASWRPEGWAG